MNKSKLLLSLLAGACLLQACSGVDFKKTSAGIPYKVFSSAKGDSIRQNYVVKFMVVQKVRDSIRFSSYRDNMPQYAQVQPIMDSLTYSNVGGNIMELLPKLKNGDSLYIVQSADSILKANPTATTDLKKGDQIITTVRIVNVFKTVDAAREAYMKDQEGMMKAQLTRAAAADKENLVKFKKDTAAQVQLARDNKEIEAYLAAHHIQAQKTDWGVYIQVLQPGSGPTPEIGKFASVKYKGLDLNGQVFDQGTYPLQIGTAGSIKGFEEGVRQLNKGEKAIIYIPSVLGYGANGAPPKIKPNQNLVFELELLEITDTQPRPEMPAMPDTTAARK